MTTAGVAVSRIETADDYFRVIARLNPRWRVIECRDGIQWILQRRGSPEKARRDDWRGRSYCPHPRSPNPLYAGILRRH